MKNIVKCKQNENNENVLDDNKLLETKAITLNGNYQLTKNTGPVYKYNIGCEFVDQDLPQIHQEFV